MVQAAVGGRERALPVGAVEGGEYPDLFELARAPQRQGVRATLGEHRVEHRSYRNQAPGRGLDQPRIHAVSCGHESVLGEDLSVRSELRRVTLELEARKRLDQRDEGGHVRERRLGVHHPHLDGSEPGLRSHVPPEEVRVRYGPGPDHCVERVHVVGVAGEGTREPGARERLEDDGANGVEAAVASLRERRVGRQREKNGHAAA
jgi:hypothetical protein